MELETSKGFSLLELMIALVFNLLLISSLITLYLGYKKTYSIIQQLEDLRANGQTALYFLSNDLREVGLVGCKNFSKESEVFTKENLPIPFDTKNFIHGYKAEELDFINTQFNKPKPDSDAVLIEKTDGPESSVIKQSNHHQLTIAKETKFMVDQLLMISDCVHSEIIKIKKISSQDNKETISTAHPLKFTFQAGATLRIPQEILYYVADTGAENDAQPPRYALFRKDLLLPANLQDGVAEDLSQLKFRYLIKKDLTNRYTELGSEEISKLNLWPNVLGIKIFILCKSPAPNLVNVDQEWDSFVAIRARH